ncbi:MAG: acyl-CoA dehydrogenase [Acidimicrobiia bacterium]|nr:acyl-CoA dehydrogenase [Acidimicrobiia bacterium]
MSHYRSNLRDIEFNLFEFLNVQDYLGSGPFNQVDATIAGDILREIERLAGDEWAASFVDADRTKLELVDGEVRLPDSLKASLAAARSSGFDRMGLSEQLGGFDVSPTLFWGATELLMGGNATAYFYLSGGLFARVIFDEGTEEQQKLAKLMVEKDWAGTMVLTEPDAGSDVGAGTTRAIHIEGETYHLEGVKRFITGGEHDAAENIIHLVLARPEGARPGTKGLSLFIVPKYLPTEDGSLGARNGVFATNLEDKMGIRGSTTCELTFGADEPAIGYLVGGVHDGIRQMFKVIEHARMLIGTKSTATLSTGYLNALEYAQERLQGPDLTEATDKTAPKVPIIRHPDVRRLLMTQKAYAEGLRALVLFTAWVQDQAILDPDGPWRRRSDLLLPLVKGYSSEKAYELLAQSLQVFGGSGFTRDYPIEQYIRDAKIDTVYEGTTAIQALDLFFRKIARDQGRTLTAMASEVIEYVKAGTDDDPFAVERELLGTMIENVQGQLGTMVSHLMGSMKHKPELYKAGLHANSLLESVAELTIGYLLLRQAEVALAADQSDPFYQGKVAAARFFVVDVAPKIAARRERAEREDGSLMDLPVEAF